MKFTGFFNMSWLTLSLAVFLLFGSLSQAFGQMDQGSIVGTVADSTGAIVPKADVKLVNEQNGFALDRIADDGGSYVFTPIKIGTYTLTVTAAGFRTFEQKGVNVTAGSRIEVPLTLSIASSDQTVEVSAAPPALQTQEASTGATVSAEAIVQTPLLNRNPIFVAQLTPGVVPAEQGSRGANKGDFSANGQRSQQNNYILDGVDNNAVLVDIPNGASYVIKPVPDALQEFKVQTSNYNAELGRGAGAVVNMSIKSGTNQLHGSLWEYWRNDILNARDYFAQSVPKYRQNQFGGTIGGPVLKNKLFLFGDVEANRILFGQSSINTVPTALMRTGDFTQLLNSSLTNGATRTLHQPGTAGNALQQCNGVQNVFCANQISTTAQAVFNALPAPNFGAAGQTYNNYLFQGAASDNTVQYDGRVDWNIRDHDQAFVRYSVFNEVQNFPLIFGVLDGGGFGSDGNITNKGRNFTASETHFFSPTLSNELRFGYNWINANYTQANSGTDVSTQLGLGGIPFSAGNGGTPHFNIGGLSSFGSPEYVPTNEYENVAQLLDNVSKVIHKHTLKAGVNFQRIRVQTLQPNDARGNYNFTGKYTGIPGAVGQDSGFGAADFIANSMESAAISNISTVRNRRWYRSAYFQDDWQVMPKLTINLGLRWEYFQPVEEETGRQANFLVDYNTNTAQFLLPNQAKQYTLPDSLLASLAANNVPVVYTGNSSLANAQKLNFSPRFGFSYEIDPKTVVRGGFGLFYGGIEAVGFYPNLGANAPFLFTSNITSAGCDQKTGVCPTNGLALETGFAQAEAVGLSNYVNTPDFRMYPKNIQTPYTEATNLSVQRQITNDTTVTLSYVGSYGRHLTSNPKANQIPTLLTAGADVQGSRPFNQFGGSSLESYSAMSNYHGGQATVEHRAAKGLYFLATYTWSKNLDDAFLPLGASGQSGSGYRNWRQLGYGYDYGAAYSDTRHRAVVNVQYDLPFGQGRKYLNQSHLVDAALGGWSLTTLFRVQTGQPQVVGLSNDTTNGAGQAQAIRVGNPRSTNLTSAAGGCATKTGTVATWFNPCAFESPEVATGPNDIAAYGGYGRDMVYGPGYNRVDLSLSKKFTLYRETALDIRADLFNALNTPAYGQPNATFGSAGFGTITSTRFGGSGTSAETPDARVAQLSARLHF